VGARVGKSTGQAAGRGQRSSIVYPTKLTNGPKTEARVVPESEKVRMSQKISRAGVASFLLQAATEDLSSRSGVVITG
jgi:hypothetical protein